MSKTKYILILIVFTALVFESCKKQHPDEFREPFTDEQLAWINNKTNPKYRCISNTVDSLGNNIEVIDTIISNTYQVVYELEDVVNDEYLIKYYNGEFYLWFSNLIKNLSSNFSIEIVINNAENFNAKLFYTLRYDITNFKTDTALVNGILYNEVYKISDYGYKHIYFKKGTGFLYLEKFDGSNATLIENTAKAMRFLKPVRFNDNNKNNIIINLEKPAFSNGGYN